MERLFELFDKTIGAKNGVMILFVLFSILCFSTYYLDMPFDIFPLNVIGGFVSIIFGVFTHFMTTEKQIKTYFNVN